MAGGTKGVKLCDFKGEKIKRKQEGRMHESFGNGWR